MHANDLAILLVLAAAILHASWNAIIKKGHDRLLSMAQVDVFGLCICLPLFPFVGWPSPHIWLYIAGSTVFATYYKLCLVRAYKLADFSQVYPVLRGTPPLLVVAFSVLFLDDALNAYIIGGITLLSIGIFSIILSGKSASPSSSKYLLHALLGGICIASYSIIDGLGAREAKNALQYATYLHFITCLPLPISTFKTQRHKLTSYIQSYWPEGLFAGGCCALAYTLVLWAMTIAPIAQAAALRESSIIFAGIIGSFFFKEHLGHYRILACILVAMGAMMIKG
ncbi:drug/metabolite transporter (DMT)-like permease [Sinobacterium caligoides]|uniref:Drug/metabolite transporter (DMT)-like permease n=1 Tax=Sinobacterium caligoides TaxID=933926 RepID=A0A3N2E0P1_9GAMM|nr:DMT family transporter [Sinobacterium caligoides]ROS05683.1 drug/metabolite transporter (DMT)-like permease [Sinobacterium caligoides]